MNQNLKRATVLALATAVFSGVNNFLAKIAVTAVKDPIVYTTLKNSIVAVFLIGIVLGLKKWPEIKSLRKDQWLKLGIIGTVGGSLPFALFFSGLSMTSALNAAIIHKTLFFWVFLLAVPILKERLTEIQWFGAIAILGANFFTGSFAGFNFDLGELMILGATILWAVENIVAKKALADISSATVGAARMIFGSLILFIFLSFRDSAMPIISMNAVQWGWTAVTSFLLFGYVLSWYAALKKAPATYVAVLLVPATLVTNLLSSLFVTHTLTGKDVLNTVLFIVGTGLVIFAVQKPDNEDAPKAFSGSFAENSKPGFMDGVLRCSRYAFGPNRLHYCGPDANREIGSYIEEGASDPGLTHLMEQFKTMYPYLHHIAEANRIANPFDERVVEAYWIGNELLESIEKKKFYHHLIEGQRIKDKLGPKDFGALSAKIGQGAVPHHSFHVLDIWKRTGNLEKEHTLYTMDECRVSWGRVTALDGPTVTVFTRPLRYAQGKLFLGEPVTKKVNRQLQATYDIEQLKIGDIVSIHWSVPCEVISEKEAATLEKYTLRHIALANLTI
jgi:drug/metabolite transporter (DMT)-like permease